MKKLAILAILTFLLVALTSCYPGAFADGPDTLEDFLKFLLTSGGIGAAVAFVFEKAPYVDEWFASQDSKTKRAIVLISCFVVPSVVLSIAIALGYYEFSPDIVYMALRAGFEAFMGSQLAHMIYMSKKPF